MVRIQDHLGKISWTLADKALYLLYGFVNIAQNNALPTWELGLYTVCNALQTFIFAVSDGFILQSLIIFGADARARGSVNRFVVLWHCVLTLGASALLLALQAPFAAALNEPRLTQVALFLPLFCALAIPRTLCLKYLIRDVQARAIFAVNAVWIGVMTALTAFALPNGLLDRFEAMFAIAAAGMGASSLAALWITRKQLTFRVERRLSWRELWRAGAYQGAASMMGNVARHLDVTMIQYFFGAATVGVYQSAKTLFRFFDEGFSAVTSLVYPATVRFVYERRYDELIAMLSKMLSFSLFATLALVALAELGAAEFAIGLLLSPKYAAAAGYFRLLAAAAPALPFIALVPVLIALGEMRRLLAYIALALAAGATALALAGAGGFSALAPLGVVAYSFTLAALTFSFFRARFPFPLRLLWRVAPDAVDFARRRFAQRKRPGA